MTTLLRSLALLGTVAGALALTGCASKQSYVNAKGAVKLDRRQITEIHEAFKSDVEKVIVLESTGEVNCPDQRCYMPVVGSAQLMKEGKAAGETKVKGTLVFTREATTRLLDIVELSHKKGHEMGEKGAWGEVTCDTKVCKLTFTMENDTQVPVSTLLSPRETASEEAPPQQ